MVFFIVCLSPKLHQSGWTLDHLQPMFSGAVLVAQAGGAVGAAAEVAEGGHRRREDANKEGE